MKEKTRDISKFWERYVILTLEEKRKVKRMQWASATQEAMKDDKRRSDFDIKRVGPESPASMNHNPLTYIFGMT